MSSVCNIIAIKRVMVLSLFVYSAGVMSSTNHYAAAVTASSSLTLPSGETLQDPTKPKTYRAPKAVEKVAKPKITYQLNYVLVSPARTYAVINGKSVSVGGSVSGAKVLAIEPQQVTLNVAGKKRTLTLNQVKGIKK